MTVILSLLRRRKPIFKATVIYKKMLSDKLTEVLNCFLNGKNKRTFKESIDLICFPIYKLV